MRNAVIGGIGALWGAAILIYSMFRQRGEGAYAAGQIAGTIFGVLMFGAGVYYLIMGIRSLGETQPRRKKRKRRRREDDEDDEE